MSYGGDAYGTLAYGEGASDGGISAPFIGSTSEAFAPTVKKKLNLVVLSGSNAHAAVTNTIAALEAAGNVVTNVPETQIASTDMTVYDAMVAVRSEYTNRATLATEYRTKIDAGTPLFVGLPSAGAGETDTGSLPTSMRLMGDTKYVGSSNETASESIDITNNTHEATQGLALGVLPIYTADNWHGAVASGHGHVGTELADGLGLLAGLTNTFAIESGTADLDSAALGARVVVSGHLYGGQSAYTADGQDFLDRMVRWLDATEPAAPSAQSLATPFIVSTSQVHAPVVASGQSVTAPFIASGEAIYAPTVVGPQTIAAPFLASMEAVHAPTVAPVQVVTSSFMASDASLYAPTVAISEPQDVLTPFITSAEEIFELTVGATIFKVWDGTVYVTGQGRIWTGSEWALVKTKRRYDGSTWAKV